MAYEVKTYYLDVSYYPENPNGYTLDELRKDKINKVIDVFGFKGGTWTTEKHTWYENGVEKTLDVATGRYATLEGYPFTFYIERGADFSTMAQLYVVNPETMSSLITLCYMTNRYYDNSNVTDFTRYHFCGMVEKIIDVGGGCHFNIIQKMYNNDKTYSYDGNRQQGFSIVPVYDTETNELFDWVIRCSYGWYMSKDMTKSVILDFTNANTFLKISNSGTTSTDYPTLTTTQVIYSTVGAYNKYYTVGLGSVCKGLSIDTGDRSHWNNRSNIKDKIVLPKAKDDNDLYFVNSIYGVVAYVENEEE